MRKSTLLDIFFPRHCLSCQKLMPIAPPDTYLCGSCKDSVVPMTASRCPFCYKNTVLWETCDNCRPLHSLDRLLVAADYGDLTIKRMVKALKYRFVKIAAFDIGAIMAEWLKSRLPLLDKTAILASIPLHSKRLRWRGFNQSELIADQIAAKLSIPVHHDLLVRTEHKTAQADIDNRDERIKNASGLFSLAVSPLKTNTIILVDDVATTGSTLDNAAHVLKTTGIKTVIGFVFARGG